MIEEGITIVEHELAETRQLQLYIIQIADSLDVLSADVMLYSPKAMASALSLIVHRIRSMSFKTV